MVRPLQAKDEMTVRTARSWTNQKDIQVEVENAVYLCFLKRALMFFGKPLFKPIPYDSGR
jgi:hypothetical protein